MSVHINCTPLNFVQRKLMTNTAQEEYSMGFHANLLCTRCDVKGFTLNSQKAFYDHQQTAPFFVWFLTIRFIVTSKHTYEEASSAN